MMTGTPTLSATFCPRARLRKSTPPPGGTGTMMRNARLGNGCAAANPAANAASKASATRCVQCTVFSFEGHCQRGGPADVDRGARLMMRIRLYTWDRTVEPANGGL